MLKAKVKESLPAFLPAELPDDLLDIGRGYPSDMGYSQHMIHVRQVNFWHHWCPECFRGPRLALMIMNSLYMKSLRFTP